MHTRRASPDTAAGFTAGTLVHAEAGPVPIERIQAGDRVWSCAEDGQYVLRLQPVLHTAVLHGQPLVRVVYKLPAEPNHDMALACTRYQAFWAEDERWVQASRLKGDYFGPSRLRLRDGSGVDMRGVANVYRTDRPGVGWIGPASREAPGSLWNYHTGRLVQGGGVPYAWGDWDLPLSGEGDGDSDDLNLRATVHSIDVGGFRTCFVGVQGVWVGTASSSLCEVVSGAALRAARKAKGRCTS